MGDITFEENKEYMRQNIISSVKVFQSCMLGKCFLYVFADGTYIEVFFRKSSFSHLTGVKTNLSANDFFDKAKKNELSTKQFWFDNKNHPFHLAKKKTDRLSEICRFIESELIVLKDIKTDSCDYKFGFKNTDLVLCLTENLDQETNKKIDDYYIPASFRVGDDIVSKSKTHMSVKYIFMKNNKNMRYNFVCHGDVDCITGLSNDIIDKLDIVKVIPKEIIS